MFDVYSGICILLYILIPAHIHIPAAGHSFRSISYTTIYTHIYTFVQDKHTYEESRKRRRRNIHVYNFNPSLGSSWWVQIPQNLDGSWEALRHIICILITKLPTIGAEIGETIHDGISFISNRRVEKPASGSGFGVAVVVVVVVTGRCL
jgi:hypothetical protein